MFDPSTLEEGARYTFTTADGTVEGTVKATQLPLDELQAAVKSAPGGGEAIWVQDANGDHRFIPTEQVERAELIRV